MKAQQKVTYGGYYRKSSEAEDKQTLSVETQEEEMVRLSSKNEIKLDKNHHYSESRSAKEAFNRPEFERMVDAITKGHMQGILTWHANRLARNAVDAARLVEQMDKGKLIEIVTPSQIFRNTPQDKFYFTLMCSQAKMENDSKGIDVKRGLRKKYRMGYPTGVAKPGFVNDYGTKKGDRKILVDPNRFDLVKQLFRLFLSGKYSVRALLKYSDEVLGLKTIQREKEGGKAVKLSRLYSMLQDPFYAGFFYGKDDEGNTLRYEVNETLPRMITETEYWDIQAMLGRKGTPRPSVNRQSFAYSGRTKCGTCGGSVTAEHKYQLICSGCKHKFAYQNKEACPVCEEKIADMQDPLYLHYVYYHCTKRKDTTCPEGSMRDSAIDNSMAEYVESNLAISKALSEWCIRHLDELTASDRQNEYERKATWEKELAQKQKEGEELVRMRMKGLVADEEYIKQKEAIDADKHQIKQVLANMGDVETSGVQEAKKAFSLVVGLAETFRNGTFDEKQEALSALGSNLFVKDKKLNVINKELFSVIVKGLLEARAKNETFEPAKSLADKDETEAFASVRPTMLRG